MTSAFLNHLSSELEGLKSAGLYKSERVIASPQSAEIEVGGRKLLNFCANNYLGLADNGELREAAKATLDRYGYGMASVRFICGTQEEHKQLEARISAFLGMEDTILARIPRKAHIHQRALEPEQFTRSRRRRMYVHHVVPPDSLHG